MAEMVEVACEVNKSNPSISPPIADNRSGDGSIRAATAEIVASLESGEGSSCATIAINETDGGYVDVHAHLIHPKFLGEEDAIALKCQQQGIEYVIVNGLEPESNRGVLELCARHKGLLPSLGIYPLDAACNVITATTWKQDPEIMPPPRVFDVDAEIDFIEQAAANKLIVALGECGMDKHYLTDDVSLNEQERVLRKCCKIAVKYDLPIILHSRKAEKRVFDILLSENVQKADFHCFCGKLNLAKKIADAGYYLSIPSAFATNTDPNNSFRKIIAALPMHKLLTETDSPYMGPYRGERNDPTTVRLSVDAIAQIKQCTTNEVKVAIRENFRRLFQL